MTNFLLKKAGLAFDEGKTRVALKKATLALLMVIETKTNSAKAKRKKVAAGLQSGMTHQASMDVEQLIRQDFEIQAYDAIKVHCNQLADRLRVLGSEKECPLGTKQAVCTLIWAAGKAEVPEELEVVKVQLTKKYGKDFATKALNNDDSCINKLVAEKLLFQADPAPKIVEDYLDAIEKESNVPSTVHKVQAPPARVQVGRVAANPARVPAARVRAPAATAPTKRAAIVTESPPEESPMKNASKPLTEASIKSPRKKASSETRTEAPGKHPKETPEEETPKRTRSRESPEDETPKTAPTTTPSSSTSSPTIAKQTPPQFMKYVAAATANHDAPESEPPVTPESLKALPVSIRRAANAAAGAVRPIIPA